MPEEERCNIAPPIACCSKGGDLDVKPHYLPYLANVVGQAEIQPTSLTLPLH